MKNKIQICVGVRKCRTQAGDAARRGAVPDARAEPFAAPGLAPSLLLWDRHSPLGAPFASPARCVRSFRLAKCIFTRKNEDF